jgi:uncharacterized membrane protein
MGSLNLRLNSLLAVTFIFICLMIAGRIYVTKTWQHVFLTWNIFLAWIPFQISKYYTYYRNKQRWKQLVLFGSWLLFFPNALYIVTDLIHLQETVNAPVWFDAVILFTSSFIGLIMAYISLFNTERFLAGKFSGRTMMLLIPFLIFISSFGVYLGRFRRWNSWDIIHSPLELGEEVLRFFIAPQDNYKSWGVTIIFSVLFYLLYAFSKLLPYAFRQNRNAG